MKNTLLNLLMEKDYNISEHTNTITFFNDIYSVNLCTYNTTFTVSINSLQSDTSSSKLLISFSSMPINIKGIRNWLHTIMSLQITESYNTLNPLTLINNTILKTACSDLLNLLDEYLIYLAINHL